jgi:hypothetical protein
MRQTICYAVADTPRALLALAFPVLAIGTWWRILASRGYSVGDYPYLLASGELTWVGQAGAWLGLVFWLCRYYPPALSALWNGPCLVGGCDGHLILWNGLRLPLSSITSVRVHRGWLRKVAYIETNGGRLCLPLLFVRSSSDPLLSQIHAVAPAPE